MQRFHKIPKAIGVGTPVIGNSSEVFSKGDPVTIDADGFLQLAASGERIIGFCLEDITMASDNETVDKVCPQYIPARPGVQMVFTSDQACTQTDVGSYANLVGTTSGSISVDLAGTTSGQFVVLGFDPENDGDTDLVVVEVAEVQTSAAAQA